MNSNLMKKMKTATTIAKAIAIQGAVEFKIVEELLWLKNPFLAKSQKA